MTVKVTYQFRTDSSLPPFPEMEFVIEQCGEDLAKTKHKKTDPLK